MSIVLYDQPGPRSRRQSMAGSIAGGLLIGTLVVLAVLELADRGALDLQRWRVFTDPPHGSASGVWLSLLVDGLGATLRAAVLASVLAVILGIGLVVVRLSAARLVRYPAAVVTELFRGIPVVLLMFFGVIALGLPIFLGVVFGLAMYNSAVISEILRSGVASLSTGQSEAAAAIGLTRTRAFFLILLPQAIRRMLPSLVSQLVVLLKDTSLGFIIAYTELLRIIRLNAEYFGNQYIFPLFAVGATIYVFVNFLVSRMAVRLERRGTTKSDGHARVG